MANRGPLDRVQIISCVYAGRQTSEEGAAALAGFAEGDGTGTVLGALSGNVTLTVAQILSGFVSADANGSNRTVTLPSLALLTDSSTGVLKGVGDRFTFVVANVGAANNLTVTGVTSVTVKVADTGDATVTPAADCTVTLVRTASGAVSALCNLFAA